MFGFLWVFFVFAIYIQLLDDKYLHIYNHMAETSMIKQKLEA